MARTTSELLSNVKRRGQIPDDSGTLSDSDILAFATDELQNVVMPRLMAMNEWHYAFTYTESLSSSREYRINPRVSGNRIISIEYYDGTNYRFIRLNHPLTQRSDLGENYSVYGNKIVLSDAVPSSGSLRIRAVMRPGVLVSSGCFQITAITPDLTTVTISDSSSFSGVSSVDIVYGTSPYEVMVPNAFIDDLPSGTQIAFVDALPDLNVVSRLGRVCPAEQTDRIPLPDELHDYLAQRVVVRCMEARGFKQDMENHLRKLADMEVAFDRLVSPRNKGEFKAVVSEDWFFDGRL